MKMMFQGVVVAAVFLGVMSVAALGYANQASVRLEVPASAPKGSEITIKVMVNHSGNSFGHYVDWVVVEVNGQEIQRWKYSSFDRPESESFTREVTYTVTGPAKITAKANCNLHGSAGAAVVNLKVE